jgi:hypothetical protein
VLHAYSLWRVGGLAGSNVHIRMLLGRVGLTEAWLLAKLDLQRLDDVPYARAEQVIRRLGELARERGKPQP